MAGNEKLAVEIVVVTIGPSNGKISEQKKSYKGMRFPEGVAIAEVEASVGATINVGNYESMRVDCRIKRNCIDSAKAITETQDKLFKRVIKHLDSAIKKVKEEM